MIKVIIQGDAYTSYHDVKALEGISDHENFTDYIDNDYGCLTGGHMYFKHANDSLYTVTEYTSSRKLTTEELKALEDYTQGQWSDGIGECFEQTPCYTDETGEEVYISPWHCSQEITSYQEEI